VNREKQRLALAVGLVALIAAVVNFFLLITDYRNLFVHPDNHQFILKESLKDGLAIGLYDIPGAFQLRADSRTAVQATARDLTGHAIYAHQARRASIRNAYW